MFILFILSNLFLHDDALAAPTPLQPLRPLHSTFEIVFYPRKLEVEYTQRSVGNIIWSCASTISLCLWVVVHPNIPGPSHSMFLTRLKIMAWMLIAPELVIVWAGRQLFAARLIAANHKDQGWTITHGFLASMGGFMLYADGNMIKTLDIETLEQLYKEDKIDWPNIKKEEIEDKSKGDFASKGLAFVQTAWFITQCIFRGAYKIGLTQLELATLAFSALNIILSVLWMYKPLGVAYPFKVHLRLPASSPHFLLSQHSSQSTFRRFLAYFLNTFNENRLFAPIFIFIIEPFNFAWSSVNDLITCETLNKVTSGNQFSVPTFYAPYSKNSAIAQCIGLCVGILFGGIHCVACTYLFPSSAELYIWGTSAISITAIPIGFLLIVENVRMQITDSQNFSLLRILTIYFLIALYCISRVALVILPILSLRRLPPDAFVDFQWSSFIPHL